MSEDKYVWVREYFLDNMIDKNQAFNFANKPTPGYVPITIVRGHDNIIVAGFKEEETPPPIPTIESTVPSFHWKIRHKLSGHILTTKNAYPSFHEGIQEQWPGQTLTTYKNYEAIEPVNP